MKLFKKEEPPKLPTYTISLLFHTKEYKFAMDLLDKAALLSHQSNTRKEQNALLRTLVDYIEENMIKT